MILRRKFTWRVACASIAIAGLIAGSSAAVAATVDPATPASRSAGGDSRPARSTGRSAPLPGLPTSPHRQLAPGVLREIAVEKNVHDTYSRHDIVELLRVNPSYDWAKDIRFDHEIWCLEFAYKPLRFISADVPTDTGHLQRKTVWYLVYRVKNPTSQPVPFYPWFVLESTEPMIQKAYPDRLVPAAIPAIVAREDRSRALATTVSIGGDIPPGAERWGVATWTDIDPKIDQFSIYIAGLTNAYRWRDDPQQGRVFLRKMLELNFWRPGDEFLLHESEIRVGGANRVDHRWVYR